MYLMYGYILYIKYIIPFFHLIHPYNIMNYKVEQVLQAFKTSMQLIVNTFRFRLGKYQAQK